MERLTLALIVALSLGRPGLAPAQEQAQQLVEAGTYGDLIQQADAAYEAKDYAASARLFSQAFKTQNWNGTINDYYNAACSWSLAANADSAFSQLFRIARRAEIRDYLDHMMQDPDLASLHSDTRWKELRDLATSTKEMVEATWDKPLVAQLDSIFVADQSHRMKVEEIIQKFGRESKEFQDLLNAMREADSVNVIKITKLIDQHGWLGADVVGTRGNETLFLVIQHADLAVQDKYLSVMREAVSAGKASASHLALLEDRVNLAHGKRQIYGSQIRNDPKSGEYYVLPLEDPDHVDERRAAVGLGPLADYVGRWKIVWDLEQYKTELPEIEARMKQEE